MLISISISVLLIIEDRRLKGIINKINFEEESSSKKNYIDEESIALKA